MTGSMKLGSKLEAFQRRGQAWFCTSELASDIKIKVEQEAFHLHKFPMVSRNGRLVKLVEEMSEEDDNEESSRCQIQLVDIPESAEAFELTAKLYSQVKVELITTNVVALCCVVEYLEMTDEFGDGNLIAKIEVILQQMVFRNWLDSMRALESCSSSMPQVEELGIVEKFIHYICVKACTDPSLVGWPIPEHQSLLQSHAGNVLWNGISTSARACVIRTDWWYDDLSILSLPLLERVVTGPEARGTKLESIDRALVHYAKKLLPGLHM